MAKNNYHKSLIQVNECIEAQSIEEEMRQVMESGTPIQSVSPMIYTDKKDGVLPAYDIRTDRFDIALNAMDKVNKSLIAKRDNALKEPAQAEPTPKTE